jgi:hypothetical protein
MRAISETAAIELLNRLREEFRLEIAENYEFRAASCRDCVTQGICCTDRHFVNVEISKLEAVAIRRAISCFPYELRQRIISRARRQSELCRIEKRETYACPLFEPGIGCTVHDVAKPFPCIFHSCYEKAEHLPPAGLLYDAEKKIAKLNERVYLCHPTYSNIPFAISGGFEPAAEDGQRKEEEKKGNMIPNRQIIPDKRLHSDTDKQEKDSECERRFTVFTGYESGKEPA